MSCSGTVKLIFRVIVHVLLKIQELCLENFRERGFILGDCPIIFYICGLIGSGYKKYTRYGIHGMRL